METSLGRVGATGALFLVTHLIPLVPGLRAMLVWVLSERGYLGAFVLVSFATLGLYAGLLFAHEPVLGFTAFPA